MREKAVHIAFYPSDWLAGTRGLTPAETGIYITLTCMMYERQGPLPFDHARLARMCNCPAGTFKKILTVLMAEKKLIETPEGLWQRRVEREIGAAREAIGEASDRAKRAADARWSKSKPQSDHHENATVKPQSVEQQDEVNTQEKSNKNSEGVMQEHCASNANQNQNQNQSIGSGDDRRADDFSEPRERILKAIGVDPVTGITGHGGATLGTRHDMDLFKRWKSDLGLDAETIIAVISEVMDKKPDRRPPNSFRYFNPALQREAGRKGEPALAPIKEDRSNVSTARNRRSSAADDAFVRVINAAAGTG